MIFITFGCVVVAVGYLIKLIWNAVRWRTLRLKHAPALIAAFLFLVGYALIANGYIELLAA